MLRRLIIRTPQFKSSIQNISADKTNSIDQNEIQHFKQFTSTWWDELGPIKPLHAFNKLRVPLIRDGIINTTGHNAKPTKPLEGFSILDAGCGGGILTEPLARIGALVTGIDANKDLIEKASAHAKYENLNNISYCSMSIEEHAQDNKEKYDAVVASEVIEHVTRKEVFLAACAECLKPGGSIFLTTPNKTWISKFTGIFLAEEVFKILPGGTHEFEKFIEPHKLQGMLQDLSCKTLLVHGIIYNPFTNEWSWCDNNSISYAIHAIKIVNF